MKTIICGASSGLGLELAKIFASDPKNEIVMGFGRRELKGEIGFDYYRCDALKGDELQLMINEAGLEEGEIDSLVVCIGDGSLANGSSIDIETWKQGFDTNLFGCINIVNHLLKVLRRGGGIIFINSICGLYRTGASPVYSCAKGALKDYANDLAARLGRRARVNSIYPGNILSEGNSWDRRLKSNRKETLGYISDNVPLDRFIYPAEIARLVEFLSSDLTAAITGANIAIDGGQTAKSGGH